MIVRVIMTDQIHFLKMVIRLLMCGTFNPFTISHLRMLEVARHYFKPEHEVEIIVSPVNDRYCKQGMLPSHHRIAMIEHSLPNWLSPDKVYCDSWECEQLNWNKTVDVIAHFESNSNNSKPILLIGYDILEIMCNPSIWSFEDVLHILQNNRIAVYYPRDLLRATLIFEKFSRHFSLSSNNDRLIKLEDIANFNIRSTYVRAAVNQKLPMKYLISEEVIEYIRDNKLYS
ncbi:hypothetical protein GJ496_010561 [Pomphorhynchus laevis]|nr:hypothetical protein GJ496_010561 [Pomphorhynchus laevis]